MDSTAFEPHDHADCINDALIVAETLCKSRNVRLTTLRRRVLELVWSGHQPVGAYDILETLVSDGRRAAPATVYRSLEFLMEQGLIHRINSLNAFIGCNHPQSSHSGLFFICESCRAATELEDGSIRASIGALAERVDFTVTRSAVEVLGTCPACRTEPIG